MKHSSWANALYHKIIILNENIDTLELIVENKFLFQLEDGDFGEHGTYCDCPFTAWTEKYVYFPLEYDGKEYIGYAPRNPESKVLMKYQ